MKRINYRRIIPVILFAVVIVVLFRSFLFASYVVDGKSMEPTLYDGNLLMVNKVAYDIKDVSRFDVIVFHANSQDDYVKRVIGLPGDEIEYKQDKLYVNGEYVQEKFLHALKKESAHEPYTNDFTLKETAGKAKVPKGELFVMGDNRPDSLDSRSFGFISIDELVGKVDIKYWPLTQAELSFDK